MDAFKAAEIERMRLGGNKTWRDFFDAAESNTMAGIRYVCPSTVEFEQDVMQIRQCIGWVEVIDWSAIC